MSLIDDTKLPDIFVFAVFSWVTSRQRLNAIQNCQTCFLTLSLVKLYSAAKLHGVRWWLLVPCLVSHSPHSAQHLLFMMVIVLNGCQLTSSRYVKNWLCSGYVTGEHENLAITSVPTYGSRHCVENAGNSFCMDLVDCPRTLLCIHSWWQHRILNFSCFSSSLFYDRKFSQ